MRCLLSMPKGMAERSLTRRRRSTSHPLAGVLLSWVRFGDPWERGAVRRGPSATLALVLGLGLPAAAHPAWASVSTKQVSVTRGGFDPARLSTYPSVSSDGRLVAFQSNAGNLVIGDHTVYWEDVFVRDVSAGTTVRASVDMNVGDPDGFSIAPDISADGRYVAFMSAATDLVPSDDNGVEDIFVRDLSTGTTVRASVDNLGGDADAGSYQPALSADGRYVAFSSDASDLVPGDGNNMNDVYVRDLVAQTTVRASVDVHGGDPNGLSLRAAISPDGGFVAFASSASDLVPNDTGFTDVFLRDLAAQTTVRISVTPEGGTPDGNSWNPSVSAGGALVAFWSEADDLVEDDSPLSDAFVRNVADGVTTLVSVAMDGGAADNFSEDPSISADGRFVAFESAASDLVPRERLKHEDVYVRDLMTGTTERLSVDPAGHSPDGDSFSPAISPDGNAIAFASFAADLVPGVGDDGTDVFLARVG
jgi:Tol biopolymer transport system component